MRITKSELRELIERFKAYTDKRDADLQTQLTKAREANESLERRASRHGERLARLESRLKALETK